MWWSRDEAPAAPAAADKDWYNHPCPACSRRSTDIPVYGINQPRRCSQLRYWAVSRALLAPTGEKHQSWDSKRGSGGGEVCFGFSEEMSGAGSSILMAASSTCKPNTALGVCGQPAPSRWGWHTRTMQHLTGSSWVAMGRQLATWIRNHFIF